MNPLLRYPADIGPIPGKSIRQIAQEKAASEQTKPAEVIVNIKPGLRTVNGKMETVDYAKPPEPAKSSALCEPQQAERVADEPQASAEPVQAVPSLEDLQKAWRRVQNRKLSHDQNMLDLAAIHGCFSASSKTGSIFDIAPECRAACIAALNAL